MKTAYFINNQEGEKFVGVKGMQLEEGDAIFHSQRDVLDWTGCANVSERVISDAQIEKIKENLRHEGTYSVAPRGARNVTVKIY